MDDTDHLRISILKELGGVKKNSGSKGPGMNEVSIRPRSPPQCAPHTRNGHRSYYPSLESGFYGMGGGVGMGVEREGGHIRSVTTLDRKHSPYLLGSCEWYT
jgi:hypothetical protein